MDVASGDWVLQQRSWQLRLEGSIPQARMCRPSEEWAKERLWSAKHTTLSNSADSASCMGSRLSTQVGGACSKAFLGGVTVSDETTVCPTRCGRGADLLQ